MLIRKMFRTEGPAHIVRNCSTDRCSKSLHGHTYRWEIKLLGNKLDAGGMLVDFSLIKKGIGDIIDMFDHAHIIWNKEPDADYFFDFSQRAILVPFSPSAENMSIFVAKVVNYVLINTVWGNEEEGVKLYSVVCHETETGYAEAFAGDLVLANYNFSDVVFKHDTGIWKHICEGGKFIHGRPEHQIPHS